MKECNQHKIKDDSVPLFSSDINDLHNMKVIINLIRNNYVVLKEENC